MPKAGYGWGYQKARKELLAGGELCAHCGRRPASEADHQPPLSLHHHVAGTGCCELVPSCWRCAREQGRVLGGANNGHRMEAPPVVEPVGFGRRDPVWDVPWLRQLRGRVPRDATWPRLMTVPHPRAVDSLGAEVAAWAKRRRGVAWYWHQRLFATRLLEVDAAGELVWETALLTVARQVGKTHVLHDLCAWRLEQGGRFGCAQTVLSIAKDLAVVRRMQAPSRVRAAALSDRYHVRNVNGQESITWLADGSEWMIRSKEGGYSLTTSMVTVDEAWKVAASVIDDAIVPTMVEQPQSQLLLVSTAHRRASALMIGRRATALDQLDVPDGHGGVLLVEWSAPRDGELGDRKVWRMASPHWSDKRERTIAQRLAAALSGESDDVDEPDPLTSIETQWLNRWPAKRLNVVKGELLITGDDWESAVCDDDSVGPLVIGVEDHHERGAAVAFCGTLADGRFVLGGELCGSRAEAYGLAGDAAGARPGSTLVVGASLASDAELLTIPVLAVRKAGVAETAASLSTLRELLGDRVVQDRSADLGQQVLGARVTVGSGGLHLVPGQRSDLVRAAVWALRVAATDPVPTPAIHWIPVST